MKNKIKIKLIKVIDFPESKEKYVIFQLNGEPNDYVYFEAFNQGDAEFEEGKEAEVELSLLSFPGKARKVNVKRQFSVFVKKTPLMANEYHFWGKVIAKAQLVVDDNFNKEWQVVIDAGKGLIFSARVSDSLGSKLKENDYIYVEGRLDIKKVGE